MERLEGRFGIWMPLIHELHPWATALYNAANLLRQKFSMKFFRFHQHTPFPIKKSLMLEMVEEWFPEEIARTIQQPVRARTDVQFEAGLSWGAILTGTAASPIREEENCLVHSFDVPGFDVIGVGYRGLPKLLESNKCNFLCIQAAGESGMINVTWADKMKDEALEKLFPGAFDL